MGITIVAIIIGVVFGALWTLGIDVIRKNRSVLLWGINIVLGALGAVAANQLVIFGPLILGIYAVPAIIGAIVLAMVGTYGYIKLTQR